MSDDGLAGLLDELLLLDEAAEIGLVQRKPGDRLDAALQLQEREDGRHQLEHDGIVFDLRPHPRDAGREDAAMVADHRQAEPSTLAVLPRTARLGDQPRLVQKLVALEDEFLVPAASVEPEVDSPRGACARFRRRRFPPKPRARGAIVRAISAGGPER